MPAPHETAPPQKHLDMVMSALCRHAGRLRRSELTRTIAGRALASDIDAVIQHLRMAGLIAIDREIIRGREASLYRWISPDPLVMPERKRPVTTRSTRRTDAYQTLNQSVRAMTESMDALRESIDRLTAYTRGEG